MRPLAAINGRREAAGRHCCFSMREMKNCRRYAADQKPK
jgi:hypothetical protein